jgi:hypothetical protein
MLFIYSALVIGGIETFFVRMAKERNSKGLKTTILLLYPKEKSNPELLSEISKYANVIFYTQLFKGPSVFGRLFPLITPFKKRTLKKLLIDVDQIHGFIGKHVLLGHRLSLMTENKVPVTIGFYHYLRYAWPAPKLAYHERINRKFAFDYLPSESLLFFSEECKSFNEGRAGKELPGAHTFRLGVVDEKDITLSGESKTPLKIVAVGRLVEFKTYNLFMLNVVKELKDRGINTIFDIYGYGDLKTKIQQRIRELKLENNVFLKGSIEYSKFDCVVSKYDLFIGSGTAIIQASSLGVPSIVGVENLDVPKTYGFFSEVYQHEYNMKGLNLTLVPILPLIMQYVNYSDEERFYLKAKHKNSMVDFTNKSCQENMDALKLIEIPENPLNYTPLIYEISWAMDMLIAFLNSNHPFRKRHREF